MARVLVTGGVGFIGFHLCRTLVERGDTVTILDDFSDAPYPRAHKRRNEADLRAMSKSVRIVEGSVTDRDAIEPLFQGVDVVVHLGGIAGVRPSFSAPARYARVNIEGTATTLELARESGVRRFVFASSSSVYGNSTPLPAHEDYPAAFPESPYAASKRAAELVALTLAKKAPDLHITALRFFTVYGPRQRPEMAITLFLRSILAQKPVTLFGDGTMRRDFTHESDIVSGITAAMERAPKGFRAYNLGSGRPIELNALLDVMGRVTGMKVDVRREPTPLGDVDATYADVGRASRELGYAPKMPLEQGISTVLDWIRHNPA